MANNKCIYDHPNYKLLTEDDRIYLYGQNARNFLGISSPTELTDNTDTSVISTVNFEVYSGSSLYCQVKEAVEDVWKEAACGLFGYNWKSLQRKIEVSIDTENGYVHIVLSAKYPNLDWIEIYNSSAGINAIDRITLIFNTYTDLRTRLCEFSALDMMVGFVRSSIHTQTSVYVLQCRDFFNIDIYYNNDSSLQFGAFPNKVDVYQPHAKKDKCQSFDSIQEAVEYINSTL